MTLKQKQATELYVTSVEQEAYDMASQLCLPPAQVRCHVEPRQDVDASPFWVVCVDAPDAMERAKVVRTRVFSEWAKRQQIERDILDSTETADKGTGDK